MLKQLRLAALLVPFVFTATGALFAQKPLSGPTEILQYVLFADGTHRAMNDSLHYGVQVSSNSGISRSSQLRTLIGSNFFVGVGKHNDIVADIYSGGRIALAPGNIVGGNLMARNDGFVNFPVINAPLNIITTYDPFSSLQDPPRGGLVQARGHVVFDSTDSVDGPVFIQKNYTYVGPNPTLGPPQFLDTLPLPTLPALPFQTTFPAFSTKDVVSGDSIVPGAYRDLVLTGSGTVVFSQPGTYIFRSIRTSGRNSIHFLIPPGDPGNYKLYVHQDVALGPTDITIDNSFPNNGQFPQASRIYMEVHGTGSTVPGGNAFSVRDTTRGAEIGAFWAGTVYAPNGSIAIGTPNTREGNYAEVYGAFWSRTKIVVGDNVRLNYEPLRFIPVVIDPYYPPLPFGKTNNKIGSELTSLNQNPDIITTVPDNIIFRIDKNTQKVWIEVIATSTNYSALFSYLQSQGFDSVSSARGNLVLTGKFPISKLNLLNARDDINYVRPLFEPINNIGQVTTQGDLTMKANFVRSQWGIEGNGVTVGVFSDSYDTKGEAAHDVQEGDLPNDLLVVREFPDVRSDEGRAMEQIIHDIAPRARLLFRTGIISPLDFALSIKQLALPPYNSNVLVDDITYITEPFLKDGLIAKAVDDVVSNNKVTYITSAGNFGSRSYEGNFTPASGAALPPGITGTAHNFGGGVRQTLHLKRGVYTIVLQWDDNFYSLGEPDNHGALVDLDIYLVKPDGSYFGFNRNSLGVDPFEVLPFNVNEDTDADLMIVSATGPTNVKFKYILFRGDAAIEGYPNGASTIVGQANAEGAISVGAMLYANVNNLVPDFPSVASFSSRGGTLVEGSVRKKPNIVAPNGVNTTVTISTDPIFNIEPDPFPNFFGTSAAAPHAAGVAALLIEGKKKFNLQPAVTPAEVKDLLQSTALDLQEPGFDYKSGYGAIRADEAMLTIANAKPIISALLPPAGLTPANTTPFTLGVKGMYLNNQTKVYVRGVEVPTSFVNAEEVNANITGPISDDPPIQLYNPPKSPSGLDGGFSEALHLFSSKKTVTVKADNQTKKYGEPLPAFSVIVAIGGQPLASTTETLASLKLDGGNIRFQTFATATSNVANYSIRPSRTTPLDPLNPADAAILAKYDFVFEPGTLTVQKLPVKITPLNQTVTYGEFVGGVRYAFDFGGSMIDLSVKEHLDSLYRKYLSGNTLAVVNGLSLPLPAGTLSTLQNMSIMASFQSVRNARKYLVQNGQLVPITGTVSSGQVQDQRFLVDLSAQNLVNYSINPSGILLVGTPPENKFRGLIGANALANGTATATLPSGQSQTLVNGPLLAMVNGPLQAIVNGQLQALVNGVWQPAQDITVHNGQLMAVVNGTWIPITSGQIQAVVNGIPVTVDLTMQNGQLQAVVNGQLMAAVNGQLQAVVNGQLLAVVNGQLQAVVNGELIPVINGQLMAVVNGQLQAVVNGQLLAVVNGELTAVDYATVENGQLQAAVNGQLQAIVNGQLMAVVNGQLLADVNGQLLAVVNGHVTFAILVNGQLMAVVNGQLQAVVNGQLLAVVNGSVENVESYTISNGQLQAVVNGQTYRLVNGQLQAVVNGQLQAAVNNFGGVSATNNSNAAVIIDQDDVLLQYGAVGGLFSMNMITGLNAGVQKLIPGTVFDPNFDISYGMGEVTILPAPLTVDADWKVLNQGSPAPPQSFFTSTIKGLMYNDPPSLVSGITYTLSPAYNGLPGVYVITPGSNTLMLANYQPVIFDTGRLYVNPYGNGAKKLLVKTECVRALSPAEVAQSGYQYLALFTYNNRNATPVYIPQGPDNFITIAPGGRYRNTLPELFDPGLHEVYVLFSGQKMVWDVRSIDTDHKTAVTSEVNANSPKCQGAASVQRPTPETETETTTISTSVYPNPVHDKVRLHASVPLTAGNATVVMDAGGRQFGGLPLKRLDENTLELSVSSLTPGLYFVRIKTTEGYRTLRFTKL